MKRKIKLAFDILEKEMEVVLKEEMDHTKGGILRDQNGNIVVGYTNNYVTGFDPWGNVMNMRQCEIYANDGTPIIVYLNNSGFAGYDTDCHGTSFTDGQYWMNNDQVNTLIAGDGYSGATGSGSIGDVVVYYDASGNVVHSATITSFGSNGAIVYGQGGIEIANHYDPIATAASSLGAVTYTIFKGQGDKILTPW